jgi:hypothetical protein
MSSHGYWGETMPEMKDWGVRASSSLEMLLLCGPSPVGETCRPGRCDGVTEPAQPLSRTRPLAFIIRGANVGSRSWNCR